MDKPRKFIVPQFAESLIKGLQIDRLPIDPIAIALNRGIEVYPKPMDNAGCSGMLIRLGDEFAIAYATHLQNEGFENFSVAHELGHYYLPGHPDAVIDGKGLHLSRAGYASSDKYEVEADQFAAGFLMPRHLFFPELVRSAAGLDGIIHLSGLCKTSLHSTGIRYIECTRDPVAVIISENNIVRHCFMSSALKQFRDLTWIKSGQSVPRNTPTHAFNKNNQNVARGARIDGSSYLNDWFGGARSINVREDVKGLGSYGKTLTVLHKITPPDLEEEEFENELLESWTPRF